MNKEEKLNNKRMDYQANVFAVCLLMPTNLLLQELKKYDFDLADHKDTELRELCKTFGVSQSALLFRLSILKPWK